MLVPGRFAISAEPQPLIIFFETCQCNFSVTVTARLDQDKSQEWPGMVLDLAPPTPVRCHGRHDQFPYWPSRLVRFILRFDIMAVCTKSLHTIDDDFIHFINSFAFLFFFSLILAFYKINITGIARAESSRDRCNKSALFLRTSLRSLL